MDMVREHPLLAASWVLCGVAGATLGFMYLPTEWSILRRVAAGLVSGAGCALIVTTTRLVE